MKQPNFELYEPNTLAEAQTLLAENPRSGVLAGGTDVFVNQRSGLKTYERLVSLKNVPELNNIEYEPGKPPVLAVRIQEVFGWTETPRLAGGRVPLLLHLLAPNHRPQQVTDDLRSFWENTYPVVRQELRRRYPKHAWPEDPWTATAERRPRRKR